MPIHFDETTQGTAHAGTPAPAATAYRVFVLEGQDHGASFVVSAPSFVGKSATCELKLTDPKVSRRHVELDADTLGLRVRDLSSTNGVFLNGSRTIEGIAQSGDRLRLGDTLLGIEAVEASDERGARVSTRTRFGRVVGASPTMRRLFARCDQVAPTDIPVLIEGETGTGKELVAEALHEASARAQKPFVVFDCTTISPQLLESSLFGHERGAFTGAQEARAGVFEVANGGTLLIDEIGDLDIALQAKLLRAVERQEVQRIGGSKWIKVDVRLISATRRDLEAEIQAGRFRDDLYYRLAVARLVVPPLRAREGDVELLSTHLWNKLSGGTVPFPADFLSRWGTYNWPGNVRELFNAVQRRFSLGHSDVWDDSESTPEPVGTGNDLFDTLLHENVPYTIARRRVLDEFDRRFVAVALEKSGGSVARAAANFGIARRYFTKIKSKSR
ncbi:MAG: sigma 54-interacting transcriptional regulator [Polyangiaceae bacterium]